MWERPCSESLTGAGREWNQEHLLSNPIPFRETSRRSCLCWEYLVSWGHYFKPSGNSIDFKSWCSHLHFYDHRRI
ncbi:hypothetical protein Q1695_001293 [Nippostrongylus brasiliensis]|nr:hypothetical protein Q1695_001293 [Nippostrongylus brasiliensis]